MSELKRVLLISNVPQTYRIPLFNEIDRQLKQKGIGLKVVFAAVGYKRRKSKIDFSEMKFEHAILKSFRMNFGNMDTTMFTYGGINKVISEYNPDKIIVVGFSIATLKIYVRSLFRKLDYVIWSGSLKAPSRFFSAVRNIERRMLARRASAFVVYGTKAKEYLVKLGADPEKVYIGINTVDTAFFAKETNRIRETLPAIEIKHLLYIGYLIPRKNVARLIDIVEVLASSRRDFILDIVGDGSERKILEDLVAQKKLGDVVHFHGFVQKNELPRFFAQSTCFLFQTDFDVWGLVLNEAMAAGIPVLSSVNAGATFDLIVDGESGFAVDYNDTNELLGKINLLLNDPGLAKRIGKNAQQRVERLANISVSAAGFVNSIVTPELVK